MQIAIAALAGALAFGAMMGLPTGAAGQAASGASRDAHNHGHDDDAIYRGYFEDDQIADRPLSDWEGDWQSVYPLLLDGTLDPVMAHKAESGDKTAEEYRAYYEIGYGTDVDRIVIAVQQLTQILEPIRK